MPRVAGSPFRINWENKDMVIAYAKKLGPGQTVYKHPNRSNYNIRHTSTLSRAGDEVPQRWIVHQT